METHRTDTLDHGERDRAPIVVDPEIFERLAADLVEVELLRLDLDRCIQAFEDPVQAASRDRPPREGESGPLAPNPAGGVRLFTGGVGRLLALIVIRPVDLGVIALGRRSASAAAGGGGFGGKRGEAGQTPDAPQRPAGIAGGERGGWTFTKHRRDDRRRLGIEHGHRDRIRKAPRPGIDLAEPGRRTRPDESIDNRSERSDGGVRSRHRRRLAPEPV